MVSALDWDVTAANNTTIGGVPASNAMETIKVDDLSRALAAGVKSMALDIGGATASAGSSSGYTFASNGYVTSLIDGARLSFKANHANTGAATLTVDALTTKAIRKFTVAGEAALTTGDIISGMTCEVAYNTAANAAAGAWILLNPALPITGTWTPALSFGGGTTGLTYSSRSGHYTRFGGNVIIARFGLALSAKGSSTGAALVGGLPVAVSGLTVGSALGSAFSGLTGHIALWAQSAATDCTLNQSVSTGHSAITDAVFTNTTQLFGTIVYMT